MSSRFDLEIINKSSDQQIEGSDNYIVEFKFSFNDVETISIERFSELLRYNNSFLKEILDYIRNDKKEKGWKYAIRVRPPEKGSFIFLVEIAINNYQFLHEFMHLTSQIYTLTNQFLLETNEYAPLIINVTEQVSCKISTAADFCDVYSIISTYRNYGRILPRVNRFLMTVHGHVGYNKIVAKSLVALATIYNIICPSN